MRFLYTVWFRNPGLPAEDQDREWPACLVVDAADAALAEAWGNRLAKRRSSYGDADFIRASVEPLEDVSLPGVGALPCVTYGAEPSDDELGW